MTKNKMKCAGAACLSALLFVGVPLAPISMTRIEAKAVEIGPTWWPGDPNPKPGTEAWLQQNYYVGPGNIELARRCALQALLPAGIKAGSKSLIIWLANGAWHLGSFAGTFGLKFAVEYCSCILKG